EAKTGRLSNRKGLLQNLVSNESVQTLFDDDLDGSAQQVFKVENKPCGKPGTGYRTRLHEKINVAVWTRVAACNRAEHTNIAHTVLSSDPQNLVALGAD